MQTITSLSGPDLRTDQRIFLHPASHNLEWRDAQPYLSHP